MEKTSNVILQGRLEQGLATLDMALDSEQIRQLLAFVSLLQKWNQAYNLTAIRDPEQMVDLHLLDSLAVLAYIQGRNIIDIGTGAGLPGIPLAICRPDLQFTLLDSNAKKTRFVQQALLELQLPNVNVVHSRVEYHHPKQNYEMIICRAFADLQKIVSSTRHLLAEHGYILAMKGRFPEQELTQLNLPYSVHNVNVPGIDVERCLIQINT